MKPIAAVLLSALALGLSARPALADEGASATSTVQPASAVAGVQPAPVVAGTRALPALALQPAAVAATVRYSHSPAHVPVQGSERVRPSSDAKLTWVVVGIGGSVAMSNVALGTTLMISGGLSAERRLGVATLAAGITGLAVTALVAALM